MDYRFMVAHWLHIRNREPVEVLSPHGRFKFHHRYCRLKTDRPDGDLLGCCEANGAEHSLNRFVVHPEPVQVWGESTQECVPAVPLAATRSQN